MIPITNTEHAYKAFLESVKMILRLYIFSLIPIVGIVGSHILGGINLQDYTITVDWLKVLNIIKVLVLFETVSFIVAGADKFKHKYLKSKFPEELEGKSAGLVKF
jgi:hypothetical protein